ncbi:MAG TPA: type II toxin-antitoxin system PemK/MazF family toxin [Candidatus Lokiarchaeia archaeon]|nr:type II toxin-antitoxin system PemK/MazF family toxin [Candidatus Lokiarchaeia archaeon]
MARLVKGDVVVVPFPFSDLSEAKRRPALVLTPLPGDDVILCQITSQNVIDDYAICLDAEDFEEGSLNKPSNIRPNKIFTADLHIILYKIGHINTEKIAEVIEKICEILSN